MLKKMLKWFAVFFVAVAAVFAALLFVPKDNGKAYRIKIAKNQGISSVSRTLAEDGIVYNRHVLVGHYPITAVTGHQDIAPGRKTDPGHFFDWQRLQAAGFPVVR